MDFTLGPPCPYCGWEGDLMQLKYLRLTYPSDGYTLVKVDDIRRIAPHKEACAPEIQSRVYYGRDYIFVQETPDQILRMMYSMVDSKLDVAYIRHDGVVDFMNLVLKQELESLKKED